MLRLVTLNQPSSEGIAAYTCPECQSKACDAMDTDRQVQSRFNIMVSVVQQLLLICYVSPYIYTGTLSACFRFYLYVNIHDLSLSFMMVSAHVDGMLANVRHGATRRTRDGGGS